MDEQLGQIPDRVGEFTVTGRLARGRHSDVYLGEGSSGRVTIRVLDDAMSADAVARRGFGRVIADARRAAGGLPAVVADDVSAERPWVATEYVPGPTLAERVAEQGPMPESEVLAVTAGLATVLDSLHRSGIVHGELDPSAVVLTGDGARIVGLGTGAPFDAGLISDSASAEAADGSSVAYLAPEQLTGDRVGSPTDVFALGAVAYFAATGQAAFGPGTATEVAARIGGGDPDLSVLDDPRLRAIVGDCLVKNRAGRPTAAEVARVARSDRDDAASVLGLPAVSSGAAVGLVASCAASSQAASGAAAGTGGAGTAGGATGDAAASSAAAAAGAGVGTAAGTAGTAGTASSAGTGAGAAATGAAASGTAARTAASGTAARTATSSTAAHKAAASTAPRGVGSASVRPAAARGASGPASRQLVRRAVPVVLAAALVGELIWAFWPAGDDGWVPWSWPEAAAPTSPGSGQGPAPAATEGGAETPYAALGRGQVSPDRVPAVDLRAMRPAGDVRDSPLPLATLAGIPVPLVTPDHVPVVAPVPGAPRPSTTPSQSPRTGRSETPPAPPPAWRPFVTPVPSGPFVPVPTVVPSVSPVRSTATPAPTSTPRPARPPAVRPWTPTSTPQPTSTPAPLGPPTTPRPQRPTTPPPTSYPTWQPPSARPSARPSAPPSVRPSAPPSSRPSGRPSTRPSRPTTTPNRPTWTGPPSKPSGKPSVNPPVKPTGGPAWRPTFRPTWTSNPSSSRPSSPATKPPGRPSTSDAPGRTIGPGKSQDRATPRRDLQQEWREAQSESRQARKDARQDAKDQRKAAKDDAKQQRQDAKQQRRDQRQPSRSGN